MARRTNQNGPRAPQPDAPGKAQLAADGWPTPDQPETPEISPLQVDDGSSPRGAVLAACVLALALIPPAGQSGGELVQALTGTLPGMWPDVGRLAAWLTVLAIGLTGCAALFWRHAVLATRLLVVAALAALGAARLHELADPVGPTGFAEPLRDSLFGLPPAAFAAVTVAGLWSMRRHPGAALPRLAVGVGALAAWIHVFLPVGWLNDSVLPVVAALGGLHQVGDLPTALAGPIFVLAQAVLATGLLVLLVLRARWPAWLTMTLAVAVLAVPTLWAWRQGSGMAVHTLAAMLLAVAALEVALSGPPAGLRQRLALPAETVAVSVLVAVFLLLKANGLRYSTTDESLYFYAARAWSQGSWPYSDFFFSHPPLHIAVPALLYKLFGYHFLIGKWLSTFAGLGAGLAVWRMVRRHVGIWPGVAALALHLLAGEVLQASTNLTGINLTACWLMWGLWAASNRRFVLSGTLLGAAAATGFYAVGGFLTVTVLALFLPLGEPRTPLVQRLWRHPAGRLAVGFLAVWGTLNVFFWLHAGDGYIDGVYEYHFAKKAKVEGFTPLSEGPLAVVANFLVLLGAKDWRQTVYYHAAHVWLAALSPLAVAITLWLRGLAPVPRGKAKEPSPWGLLWNPRRWWLELDNGGFGLWIFVVTLAMLVEFAQFKERYDFYYALILPLAAACAAVWLRGVARLAALAVDSAPSSSRDRARWLAVAAILMSFLWVPWDNSVNARTYPEEFRVTGSSRGLGERLAFEWQQAPGPVWVNDLTRGLFWAPERIRGNLETGVHHYLWSKKRWFSTAEAIAGYIREHSQPEDTLTGASDYAPLIALLSDRRLAGNHIDTNSKVFNTGAVRLEAFWDAVCADKLKFLVVAPQSYFAADTVHKRATIIANFQRVEVFHDKKLKHFGRSTDIELWQRKAEPPAPACKFVGKRGVGPNLDSD